MSNDYIRNRQKEILHKLKERIEKSDDFKIGDGANLSDERDFHFWVGTKNGLIGEEYCHYEFIFHNEETEYEETEKELRVEVHFEEEDTEHLFFKNFLPLPSFLVFRNWLEESIRIVFKTHSININNFDDSDLDSIIEKAICDLYQLHNAIGEQLETIIEANLYALTGEAEKPRLADKGGKIVNHRKYTRNPGWRIASLNLEHGDIQEKLVKKLKSNKKYCSTGIIPEATFENRNYRIDVLAKYKDKENYDIYEVKPYSTATECIREALGQILYYKYLLEKGGYSVNQLFIVGKSKLTKEDKDYLDTIKGTLPKSIKICYKTPETVNDPDDCSD